MLPAVIEMSPPRLASADVAMVLASLVKLPVAVMTTFPAAPGASVVPSSGLVMASAPVLALLMLAAWQGSACRHSS